MPYSCQTFHLSFGKAKNKLYLCSGLIASMGIGPDKLGILRQANKLTGHQAANPATPRKSGHALLINLKTSLKNTQ